MRDHVTLTIAGHVAEVTLNRPDKKNALSLDMLDALAATGAALKDNAEVRAVVICGAGGVFSAGIDLSLLHSFATRLEDLRAEILTPPPGESANRFQKPVTVWQELDVPVIAALEGVCFGAAMQLALAADFRVATPDTRLSVMEGKWGLIPDMGITRSLPRLTRPDIAKELIMTARVLDAEEALSLGLVTRLAADPLSAARAMATDLAARSPQAVQGAKRLIEAAYDTPEALALEARLQAEIIGSPNQIEAVMAAMQNRTPKFS